MQNSLPGVSDSHFGNVFPIPSATLLGRQENRHKRASRLLRTVPTSMPGADSQTTAPNMESTAKYGRGSTVLREKVAPLQSPLLTCVLWGGELRA